MEKEDPAIVTKALATDFDDFVTKLSSNVNVKHTSESMGNVHGPMNSGSHSFTSILHNKETKKTVKVSVMRNEEKVARAAVAIPLDIVKEMSSFLTTHMSTEMELPESVVVIIPFLDGTGHSLETIDVEVVTTTQEDKNGFMEVKRKKRKAKVPIKTRQVEVVLVDDNNAWGDPDTWLNAKQVLDVINDSDCKDVDEVMDLETPHNTGGATDVGANTPKEVVSNVYIGIGLPMVLGALKALASFLDETLMLHALWQNLGMHKCYVRNHPWCIMDDFNAILNLEYMSVGSSNIDISMREFKEYVEDIKVTDVVQAGWSIHVSGFFMFQVIDLVSDPSNAILREEEAVYVQACNDALVMEELFLKQKAKIEWLWVGDSNFVYFHKSVKIRISLSQIDVVTNLDGVMVSGDHVPNAFVAHYETFWVSKVKKAIFSMRNDKSSGLDGYTAAFFKEAWDIMSSNVTKVVQEFFINGKLLKELNHMIIALIPKVASPSRINYYRPISCCNVLFKCISKIIANRIKESLKVLVSPNQSAFVSGRKISDNILLTQELMHHYHLDRGVPWCAFKVDIKKAYDTVDWGFLKEVLMAFGFHHRMVAWIMECVTTSSFSISINGVLHGYFKGLTHSLPKSTAYFCNVLNHTKLAILQILLFEEEKDSRLKNKSLLAAGRLQLVQLVLGFMHVYWASVFILPSRILLDIEQLMRGFLWCQGKMMKGKSKVAWEVVCMPKSEGGLGVRRLETFNKALMILHIWNLLSLKQSLWVKWIHTYKLKGRSVWDIPCRGNMTWGWQKLLHLRPIIYDFIWHRIESGSTVFAWFDKWCSNSPFSNVISMRDIHRAGFNVVTKVRDIAIEGSWHFPSEWSSKYPNLNMHAVLLFTDLEDVLEWRDLKGGVHPFSVSIAWGRICPRQDKVDWSYVVWDHLKVLAGLNQVSASFASIMSHLVLISKRRHARSVIAKIVVAVYSRSLKRDGIFVAIGTFWILSSARDGYGLLM
ncbi:hypothetical protein Tco_0144680 [Tanacetum coccineum]